MISNVLIAALLQIPIITGQVRDSRSHMTISDARIELRTAKGLADIQYSDEDGHFQFAGEELGGYSITATHSGYTPTTTQLNRNRGSSRIEMDLIPNVEPAAGAPSVISVRDYVIPSKARKLFQRARKEMQKDCGKAIVDFRSGLQIFSDDALAYNGLGNCYRQVGQMPDAETAFLRAISLNDSPYIAMNLADVYTAQKKYSEAETLLNNSIQKTPENGDIYYSLAAVYFSSGRVKDAERTALQADTRLHRIADLHLLLAKIYDREQNQEKVIDQLRAYLRENPNGEESQRIRSALKK